MSKIKIVLIFIILITIAVIWVYPKVERVLVEMQGFNNASPHNFIVTSSSKSQGELLIRKFFSLIDEKEFDEAQKLHVASYGGDQYPPGSYNYETYLGFVEKHMKEFKNFNSIKIISVLPCDITHWSETEKKYKVKFYVSIDYPQMDWTNGVNTKWVNLTKDSSEWKISVVSKNFIPDTDIIE